MPRETGCKHALVADVDVDGVTLHATVCHGASELLQGLETFAPEPCLQCLSSERDTRLSPQKQAAQTLLALRAALPARVAHDAFTKRLLAQARDVGR